ncbi:MAG: tRNA (adenosine(37)-N6)-threonylcarbamoyltransferase complex ATPase subunit type 1 TsaE, partial [Opitutales bacterium]
HVASPTFVFLHEYEREPARAEPDALTLIHLDAYRLTGSDDLATIGFDLDDPDYRAGCVVAVEWPERLGPSIEPGLTLTLQHAPPSRRIVVNVHKAWRDRLDTLQHALAPFQAS